MEEELMLAADHASSRPDIILYPDSDSEISEDDSSNKREEAASTRACTASKASNAILEDPNSDESEVDDENDDFDIPESLYNDNLQENHPASVDSDSAVPTNSQQDLQDFESLTPHDVADMMNQTVQSVGDILQMPGTTIRLLLNLYKWDSHKMMEVFYSGGQEEMFAKANISLPPETPSAGWSEECDICYNDPMTKENSASLQCGHAYHKECWASYLTTKIVDDGACQTIRCPGCEAIVDDDLVMEVLENKDVVDKYWTLVTNTFLEHHRNLRWCPSPGCNMAVSMEVPNAQCVTCGNCEEEFCFKCGRQDHDFIPCYIMDMWDNREKVLDGKGYFSEVLTRECPGCGRTIEKNLGCNHMSCRCGAQFCWWCLQNHSNHSASETCVNHVRTDTEQDIIDAAKEKAKFDHIRKRREKYKLTIGKTLLAEHKYLAKRQINETPEKAEKTMRQVEAHIRPYRDMAFIKEERDLHFIDNIYEMEKDQWVGTQDRKYYQEQWEKAEEAIVTLKEMKERMSDDLGWFQTDHIKKSIQILTKSQKTLMNMEIMVYFLDGPANSLFLVNLTDLEKVVRDLSKLLLQMQTNFKGYNERKKRKLDHEKALNSDNEKEFLLAMNSDKKREFLSSSFDRDGNLKNKIHFKQDSKDWMIKLVREVESDKGELSDKSSLCHSRREAIRDLVSDRAKQFVFRTIKSKSGAPSPATYDCDKCNFKASSKSVLLTHVETIHEPATGEESVLDPASIPLVISEQNNINGDSMEESLSSTSTVSK